jgi:hypothetical protein
MDLFLIREIKQELNDVSGRVSVLKDLEKDNKIEINIYINREKPNKYKWFFKFPHILFTGFILTIPAYSQDHQNQKGFLLLFLGGTYYLIHHY